MFQIFDFGWEKSNKVFLPFFKLKDIENNQIASLQLGLDLKNFQYKLSELKYCIGFYSNGEFKKCINKYSNGIGFKLWKPFDIQCFECEREQGFKSAFFFGEDPNEEMKIHLQQDHYIYLAFFSPNIIKVGTAASSREGVRLIEQDALLYAFVAKNDGFNIQKLERAISKELGITETVRSGHKFKFMATKPDAKSAESLLRSKIDQLISHFKNTEFENWIFEKDEIKIQSLINDVNIYYPKEKVEKLEPKYFESTKFVPLVGEYLGLRGRYLLFKNNSQVFGIDTRFLTGRTIENLDDYIYEGFEKDSTIGLGIE